MTEQEIRNHLTTDRFARTIHAFERLDSTNTYAKSLRSGDIEDGTLIITDEQFAGRGRHGRSWASSKGLNLTFSLILKPTLPMNRPGIISLIAGLAVTEAVESVTHIPAACKWPNDVSLNGKKCAGILSETVFDGQSLSFIVVGIGLNVNQTDFPVELTTIATSLALVTGSVFNRYDVLNTLLERFAFWYDEALEEPKSIFLHTWKAHSPMMGREISINQQGAILRGVAEDIADDGGLILQTNGNRVKVLAGEVTVLH